ncbi:MAG: HPr-rel-A system PqqD family peptide chaperone [Kiritimatiellae bacterium]|nr:HPr-rel-A system PqqD family peptide chaperone [Kiritimatiellia bacterium]
MLLRLKSDVVNVRQWSDGLVLFNCLSGDTLFFDALSTQVLDLLVDGVSSSCELSEKLSRQFDLLTEEVDAYVKTLLERLNELDLLDERDEE